jgi:acyl-CoA reductase-like NAD-dependent aldehyde dehydrogenase
MGYGLRCVARFERGAGDRKGDTAMPFESINPATEKALATYEESSPAEVEAALADAQRAFETWRDTSFAERSARLRAVAATLRGDQARLAALITAEMGKPIAESEAEIEKCAWNCEYYAENAERFLSDEPVETNARESYVEFAPLGVILAIMPWNFPFWQVFRFAAPALMAGNTAVLKHASNVPGCALAIEEVFRRSDLPAGAFRTILVTGATAEALIADSRIRAVTLTGSEAAGERVAAAAGRALKKSVLELGGSDPFVVLADADLDAAATTAARARNLNAGQSCIAAKRFIVVEEAADEFEKRFKRAVSRLKVGDPTDRETQVGPLARGDLRDALESQVAQSVAMGARVVTGGARPKGRGYFYEPTILADITPDMPVFREETFGPVAALIRARDTDQAIRMANDTAFGLGSSLWTQDLAEGRRLARRIEAGGVFINGMVASDPRLPFGGVKRSGYGRELGSFGIREFVNVQTVWIGPAAQPAAQAQSE